MLGLFGPLLLGETTLGTLNEDIALHVEHAAITLHEGIRSNERQSDHVHQASSQEGIGDLFSGVFQEPQRSYHLQRRHDEDQAQDRHESDNKDRDQSPSEFLNRHR